MNHYCLHVEVTLNVSPDDWLALAERGVPAMRSLPGLVWKLWLLDRERGTAGGLYLFRSAHAAQQYAEGPILEQLRRSPAVTALRVEHYPVLDRLSRRTFGPLTSDEAPSAPGEVCHG